jgi:hypothetical protein
MKIICTFCDWMADTEKLKKEGVDVSDISKIKCHYCLRQDMVPYKKKEKKDG